MIWKGKDRTQVGLSRKSIIWQMEWSREGKLIHLQRNLNLDRFRLQSNPCYLPIHVFVKKQNSSFTWGSIITSQILSSPYSLQPLEASEIYMGTGGKYHFQKEKATEWAKSFSLLSSSHSFQCREYLWLWEAQHHLATVNEHEDDKMTVRKAGKCVLHSAYWSYNHSAPIHWPPDAKS